MTFRDWTLRRARRSMAPEVTPIEQTTGKPNAPPRDRNRLRCGLLASAPAVAIRSRGTIGDSLAAPVPADRVDEPGRRRLGRGPAAAAGPAPLYPDREPRGDRRRLLDPAPEPREVSGQRRPGRRRCPGSLHDHRLRGRKSGPQPQPCRMDGSHPRERDSRRQDVRTEGEGVPGRQHLRPSRA